MISEKELEVWKGDVNTLEEILKSEPSHFTQEDIQKVRELYADYKLNVDSIEYDFVKAKRRRSSIYLDKLEGYIAGNNEMHAETMSWIKKAQLHSPDTEELSKAVKLLKPILEDVQFNPDKYIYLIKS